MIKKILLALLLLVVIGLVALYFTINSIVGGTVTKVFNNIGPEITGTKTYIESTSVNIFDGNIGINGLFIGNPEGFKKASAMECDEIYIDIEPSTLMSDQIVINEIRITKPSFTFEANFTSNNLTKLKKQIDDNSKKFKKADESVPEEPSSTTPSQPGKTLLLHKLVVTDGNVDLAVLTVNRQLPLPQIEEDFGGKGVTPAEAADYVLTVVLEKVVVVAAELAKEIANDPNAVLKSVTGGQAAESLDQAGEAVEKAGDAIKGLFD